MGQIAASIGFINYSAMVGNRVFIVTNSLILLTAIVGQVVVSRKRDRKREVAAVSHPDTFMSG